MHIFGFSSHWVLQRGQSNFQNTYCLFGLLAHTMGDLDKSTGHFDEGLEYARRAGFRPMLAWTCCDYSDMLKERDAEGDRAKAVALLDESLAISRELGRNHWWRCD